MTTQNVNTDWLNKQSRLLIISGPCSAESESQMVDTALKLKAISNVDILRAGIWKPRTRPNSFEGVGAVGLPWVAKAKSLTGLPATVEVAKASHVELCLEHNIDILWIGARTTVNPFAVQEIAEALKGVDIPVLVKNPINPDLALWIGGIERFEKVGIQTIGAIHRGFSNHGEKFYRNRPQWHLALEFRRLRPDIKLINDPSHICGRRDILQEVSQKAMDLNFDGLMIESHIDPDNAWSDAKQQITPEELAQLLDNLVLRVGHEEHDSTQSKLDYHRQEIDHIDTEIMHLLGNRMNVARQIGSYKEEHNMPIFSPKRWNIIRRQCQELGSKNQLSKQFIEMYLNSIHTESINQQEKIYRSKRG